MNQKEIKSLPQNTNRVYVNDNAEQDIQKNVNESQIVISTTRQRIIEEIRYGKREEVNNNIHKSVMKLKIIKNVLI